MKAIEIAQAHYRAGRLEEAADACRKVLVSNRNDATALYLMGVLYWQLGRGRDAVEHMQRAARANPRHASVHLNLGVMLAVEGKAEAARKALERARDLGITDPAEIDKMGRALAECGDLDGAAETLRRLSSPGAIAYRAWVLERLGRSDEATAEAHAALRLDPRQGHAWTALGLGAFRRGRHAEALEHFERALQAAPQERAAHWNCACTYLLTGHWEAGWREFEHRPGDRIPLPQPVWNGSPQPDRTVVVSYEQGYGDTLQFVRYLPLVRERVGRVVLMAQAPLGRLLDGAADLVVSDEHDHHHVLAADLQIPMLSLPRIFGTTPATVPAAIPYVRPPAEDVARWGERLRGDPRRKVGLAWAGNPAHAHDAARSCRFEDLAPLLAAEDVTFYSLQHGQAVPAPLVATAFRDFADTAGLVAHLDLVIAVDTAVAHLAGAMGKPVWSLHATHPEWLEWRWLLDRDDTPWYPGMRLFRQKTPGDWTEVVARVADALSRSVPAGR